MLPTALEGPVCADERGRTIYKWPLGALGNGSTGDRKDGPSNCSDDILRVSADLMSPYPPNLLLPDADERVSCAEAWPPLRAGSIQYDTHCGTCHLPTGEGSAETGPPVLGSPVVLDADPAWLINITLYGAQLPETAPSMQWQARGWKRMEEYASKLSDEQAAARLTSMRRAWGHEAGAVTAEQVAAQR